MAEKETPVPAAKQSERKELQTLNKRNYQKELDKLIENIQKEGKTPRLFLHACCAPCSSYVMEYLSQYFEITIFFYNPNIAPAEEYAHRVAEIRRLIGEMEFVHPVTLVEGRYDPREFYEMAKAVKTITDAYEVPLLINDRIDIALAVGADGVHLGQSDLPLDAARNLLGADKIVGATANTVELAQKAWREGADYLGVGDVFGTTTKADTRHITLEELKEIKESVPIPIVAIGGGNEDNIALLRETGVDGAAVISAIVGRKDITAAAEELISNFRGA